MYSPHHLSPAIFPAFVKRQTEKFAYKKKEKLKELKSGDDSSSYCSESSQESASGKSGTSLTVERSKSLTKKPSRVRRFLQRSHKPEDLGAMSDSECHSAKKPEFPDLKTKDDNYVPKITRCGSLNLGRDSASVKSLYPKRATRSFRIKNQPEDEERLFKKKTKIVKWHSFQKGLRTNSANASQKPNVVRRKSSTTGFSLNSMSCGQLNVSIRLFLFYEPKITT